MIVVGLVISGLALAAFLAVVVGIRHTEHRHGLRDPYSEGPVGSFARRVLGVYVSQAEDSDRETRGQVRR